MRSDKCRPNVVLLCLCKDIQQYAKLCKTEKNKIKKIVAFAIKFYPTIFYSIIFNTIFTFILQRMIGSLLDIEIYF